MATPRPYARGDEFRSSAGGLAVNEIGQTMVLHGLHLVRPHGEPRHSQGRNVRRELPAGWIRDLSVDLILARGTKTFAKSADVSGTARYRVTSRGKADRGESEGRGGRDQRDLVTSTSGYGILWKPRVSKSRSKENAVSMPSRCIRIWVVQSVYETREEAYRRNAVSASPSTSSET